MLNLTYSEVINRKYTEFYEKHGYLPKYFETYNSIEVTDVAPSITTKVGMLGGSSNLLIIEEAINV